MHYWFLTACVEVDGETVLWHIVRHDAGGERYATRTVDWDILWRAYGSRVGKVRQGTFVDILRPTTPGSFLRRLRAWP